MAASGIHVHEDLPAPEAVGLRLRLLGEFRLTDDATVVDAVGTRRMQSLLAYLALHRDIAVDRGYLAALLWPDSSDEQARTNLRHQLHILRRALPEIGELISQTRATLRWRSDAAASVDVADFEAELDRAAVARHRGDDTAELRFLEAAIRHFGGDLLPGQYDDWILAERERLREASAGALERATSLLEQQGDYPRAIERYRRLLQHNASRESAYQALMRLYTLTGDRVAAVRTYHACVTALREELGVDPSPATQDAYRLLAGDAPIALASADNTPGAPSLLVGRDQEWSKLQEIWHAAAGGQAQMLLVSGEAGIGKTRIVEDLLAWIARQGFTTISARCFSAEGSQAYAPVIDWLRADGVQTTLSRLDDLRLTEIARLLPEILTEWPDLPRPGSMTEDWQRQRLFEALAAAILAARQPLALLIDDLQWCDRDTLEWLRFLLRVQSDARLLVAGTLRTEEMTADHPLLALVVALHREGRLTEITLEPLDELQTAVLAASLTGRALTEDVARRLFRETEGNPLFVVETTRAGLGDAPDAVAISPTINSVVAGRLALLSPSAAALLEAAATIGRELPIDRLAAASGVDEETLVRGLDELWQRRIIRERAGVYDFSHDKLREVAYGRIAPARRRILHRRVAEAIKGESGIDPDAASNELAFHFERAGLPGQAAAYYLHAGTHARHMYANHEAIGLYRRGLALLRPGQADTGPLAQEMLEALGDLLQLTGNPREAREAYQGAIEAQSGMDIPGIARLRRRIAGTWTAEGRYGEALAEQTAVESMIGTSPANRQLWIDVRLDRLNIYYGRGDWQAMQAATEDLAPIVARHGTPLQRMALVHGRQETLLRRHRYAVTDEMLGYAELILAAAQEFNDPFQTGHGEFELGFCLLWHHDLDAALVHLQRGLAHLERVGDQAGQVLCLTYLAITHRRLENLAHVRRFAIRALDMTVLADMPTYVSAAKANLAWVAWREGNRHDAGRLAQEALDRWRGSVYPFQFLALWPLIDLDLESGHLDTARRHASQMLEPAQMRLPPTLEAPLVAAVQAADPCDALRLAVQRAGELRLQ